MPDVLDLDIDTLAPSGDGAGRHRGVTIYVPFTIPGERVRARVQRRRGREAWAALEAVLTPSPHRVAARCRHFGPPDSCGGCSWQHIDYAEQLRLKSELVQRLVEASLGRRTTPRARPTLPATAPDEPWGTRHKVHFVFAKAAQGKALTMGHYVRGSRRVFDARECPVHDPRGNAFAFRLRDECRRAGVAAAMPGSTRARRPSSERDTLRHVAVRVAANTRDMSATLVVTTSSDARLRRATRRAMDAPEPPRSLHLNLHPRFDSQIFGPRTTVLSGPRQLREEVAGIGFLISPTVFFQTNVRAAGILVQLVLETVPAGGAVLDLYAGVGLFALPLAARGDTVTAIEENRDAVSDGEASRKANGITAACCRFVAAPVERALRTVTPAQASTVVLDPPREGCAPEVIDEIFGRLSPDRAVYVSCNPESLARDLAVVARHRYTVASLQPVDMFPHTAHVETVAVLTR